MAKEEEDFSAVTNNNDRNNFFALQEGWPAGAGAAAAAAALFRQFAAAPRQLTQPPSRLFQASLAHSSELRTYFNGGGGGFDHNDTTCQNATSATVPQFLSPSVSRLRSQGRKEGARQNHDATIIPSIIHLARLLHGGTS